MLFGNLFGKRSQAEAMMPEPGAFVTTHIPPAGVLVEDKPTSEQTELMVQLFNNPKYRDAKITAGSIEIFIPKAKDRRKLINTAKREFVWAIFHALDVDTGTFYKDDPETIKFENEYGITFENAVDDIHLIAYVVAYQDKMAGMTEKMRDKYKSSHIPWEESIKYVLSYNKP